MEQGIGEVLVVEPNIKTLPKALAEKGAQLVKLDEALEKANTIVALVDHKEFNKISANSLIYMANNGLTTIELGKFCLS